MSQKSAFFQNAGEVIEKGKKREKYVRCGRFYSSRNFAVEKCPWNTLNLQSLQSLDLKLIDPGVLS